MVKSLSYSHRIHRPINNSPTTTLYTESYKFVLHIYIVFHIGFGSLEVACWPLVPKYADSNPAEAVGFLRAKNILSTPSFGGKVKPWVPCRRFAACKRSLELRGSRILDEICRNISRPQFHLPPLGALAW
jgi:hypothetical protein